MTEPDSTPTAERVPEGPAFRTKGPHPWRLVDEGGLRVDLAFERSLWDSAGRALGPSRETVCLEGAGLGPWLRLALAGYVLLGKLSPADVGALADELRAARGRTGRFPPGASLRPRSRRAARPRRPDGRRPHGAAAGRPRRAWRVAPRRALPPRREARPSRRPRLRRGFRPFAALSPRPRPAPGHRAPAVPSGPPRRQSGALRLVARACRAGGGAGGPTAGRSSSRSPPGSGRRRGARRRLALGSLFASLRRDAETIGHPLRSSDGVAEAVADELLDGLAGLLLNGLGLDRAPRPGDVASRVGPAGCLPTRARHVRTVRIAGAPFQDALGRFFAVPSCPLESSQDGPHRGGEADREVPFSAGGLVGGRGRRERLTTFLPYPLDISDEMSQILRRNV